MTKKTKKKHRRAEALRRLGGEPPPPDPNFRCHHRDFSYSFVDSCKGAPVRLRECHWDGVKRWYCVKHDPLRLEHEARNRKKREAEKKSRWQQMDRERKG